MNHKINSIHYLRGIAALLVVCFHLRENLNNVYAQANLGDLAFVSGASGVDIFFIISGFIIAFSTSKPENAKASTFLVKRFFRIYPVYFIALMIMLTFTPQVSILSQVKSVFLIHDDYSKQAPTFGYGVLTPAWSLTYEIYFYLLFLLSSSISHRYRSFICSAFIVSSIFLLQFIFMNSLSLSALDSLPTKDNQNFAFISFLSSPMLLEFIYGMLLYEMRGFFSKIPFPNLVSLGCITFFISAYLSGWRYSYGPTNFGLWAVILVTGCLTYEANNNMKPSNILNFLGDISYSLYLCHGVILALLYVYNPEIPLYSNSSGLAKFILILSFSIICASLVNSLIERPIINICRIVLEKVRVTSNTPERA
ncbi:acyltransferase family protein [Enterobacteriaceae bacterium RIT693]|nr:acyltransferase family protein [Enterobacteriaceae bacterium RIT693]